MNVIITMAARPDSKRAHSSMSIDEVWSSITVGDRVSAWAGASCGRCSTTEDVKYYGMPISGDSSNQFKKPRARPNAKAEGKASQVPATDLAADVVTSCRKCMDAYVLGGFLQLRTSYGKWAHQCCTDADFNDKMDRAVAVASGEAPKMFIGGGASN